ncbi:MAG: Uma2 family endonuclease [Pseudomonadota bacterium]
MEQPSPLYTLADLQRVPANGWRYELLHGQLVKEPPPGPLHGTIAATLTHLLSAHARATRAGVVLTCDSAFLLHRAPDTVRAPDVAYVRRDRFERLDLTASAFPGPPDLAVEVLSPSNRPNEIHGKVADYLEAGTALVWVVDPEAQVVTTYRQLLAPQRLATTDVLEAPDVLPGFTASVAEAFQLG